ncbi:hypothetical protein C731_3031 [Mycolicibacterium hassiacum DSM 44199]|uniref:Uncharacterized protein n=1 Tax=Mycolicibacterium hassiacum (strain DSM 44199 / CIP 105218 / JCM 12690 / 3849) TaxID=1122247 RepID=K5BFB4_MYCHD|nr:hypothetical protein C731_3031 [Mycolicibacterium hassiacum DSM 44199]
MLDGFDVIWSKARSTFGDGPPVDGTGFDKSGQLRRPESERRPESCALGGAER